MVHSYQRSISPTIELFPPPDGPHNATTDPGSIVSETRFSTCARFDECSSDFQRDVNGGDQSTARS